MLDATFKATYDGAMKCRVQQIRDRGRRALSRVAAAAAVLVLVLALYVLLLWWLLSGGRGRE